MGLFSSIGKGLKKVASTVGGAVKAVLPVAAGIAGGGLIGGIVTTVGKVVGGIAGKAQGTAQILDESLGALGAVAAEAKQQELQNYGTQQIWGTGAAAQGATAIQMGKMLPWAIGGVAVLLILTSGRGRR